MTEITIRMPAPHQGQRHYLRNAKRFNVLCCGRRWGKNVVEHRRISSNIKYPCAWYAPTYRMLAEDWRELVHRFAPIITRKNESEHRLEFIGGGHLDMWSLDNPDSSRGRKYKHAVINEAAMVKNLSDAWNMVIRPTLADLRGGADFVSTPKGLNDFYALWQAADDDPDWTRLHYKTGDNPHIPPEEIDVMRASLPERVYQQEIDALFVEDGAYFQNVTEVAIIGEKDEPKDHAGHFLTAGLDWALSNDYTVLTISCRECNQVVWWDRFNQIDYTYQRLRIIESLKRWKASVLPERNSIGEPNIELLIQAGVKVLKGPDGKPGFNTSATTKPALIQRLAAGLEHDEYLVPLEYADELRSYEVQSMASGHPKFSAPDGLHDDRVISLALSWWAITSAMPLILFEV